jgi:predicted Zn finger-like uncharacterized protein
VNVSCPECRSVFRVDPTKIPTVGVRARCSVCGGVIILGAGSSIEEEFGPPAVPIQSPAVAAVIVSGAEAVAAEPLLEFATPGPLTPVRAPAVATPPATIPAATTPVVAPPPRRPLTPPRAAPAPTRPAPGPLGPQGRPAAFPPRPAAAVSTAGSRQPVPASTRPATPVRPLAPPMGGAFPPRPTAAPAQRPSTEAAPPPPRPASPTPSRLPINPFLANDPNAKARRLSRALISDLVTYFPQRRDEGLREGTLRELFREEIKKSYEEYVEQVGREFADSTSHFQDALNEILAGGQKIF